LKTNYKLIIPNFITSLNILCGSLAILVSFQGTEYLIYSSMLIFIASIFDFLDGFTARLLKATSEFGKELDSLSDVVSFGLAPSFIMFQLIFASLSGNNSFMEISFYYKIISLISFIIVVFSALRLAKFNIDENQKTEFLGLPTPAFAILVAVIPLIINDKTNFSLFFDFLNINTDIFVKIFTSLPFLLSVTILFSLLLVAPITMFSLKFKGFNYNNNKLIYNFLIISILLIIMFQAWAILLIIFSYVVISIIKNKSKLA